MRTFSFFKHSIDVEPYIISNLSKSKRSLISQLRIGILPLEIESGRYTRKKLSERLCKLCNSDVEDEVHFICLCPTLNNIRSCYFTKLNIDVNESFMEQYINVICHLDVKVMSNFISEMWFTRNNIIFQK